MRQRKTVRLVKRWFAPFLLLVLSFGLSVWLLPQLNLRPGIHPKLLTMPDHGDPGENAFFVYARQKELSHPILYYDIGESIENARKADILIIGNSRAQLGFREEPTIRAAENLGLTVFNLAVGHADGVYFAFDLIRRHDLRPKIVVVNGGPFVFFQNYSRWAQEVVNMGGWNARKTVIEGTASWWLTSRLHRVLPRIEYFDRRLNSRWIHYRSSRNGWWRNVLVPGSRYPVGMGKELDNFNRSMELATKFKKDMDTRGTLIVLTTVPWNGTMVSHLEWFSENLGMAHVLPSYEGLQTADGSHLDPESASRFSKDFFERFITLPEVRAKLQLDAI